MLLRTITINIHCPDKWGEDEDMRYAQADEILDDEAFVDYCSIVRQALENHPLTRETCSVTVRDE